MVCFRRRQTAKDIQRMNDKEYTRALAIIIIVFAMVALSAIVGVSIILR